MALFCAFTQRSEAPVERRLSPDTSVQRVTHRKADREYEDASSTVLLHEDHNLASLFIFWIVFQTEFWSEFIAKVDTINRVSSTRSDCVRQFNESKLIRSFRVLQPEQRTHEVFHDELKCLPRPIFEILS